MTTEKEKEMSKKINQKLIVASALVVGTAIIAQGGVVSAADTTISSSINSVITLFTTSGTVSVDVISTAGGAQTIAKDVVTVGTNAPGYTLQLADKEGSTDLTSGANSITAIDGTQAAPKALTAGTWGYRIDGLGSFGAGPTAEVSNQAISTTTFAGVPASTSPVTIRDTSVAAASSVTDVLYSVAADTSQASGLYTNVVTYTATAK